MKGIRFIKHLRAPNDGRVCEYDRGDLVWRIIKTEAGKDPLNGHECRLDHPQMIEGLLLEVVFDPDMTGNSELIHSLQRVQGVEKVTIVNRS